MGLRWIRALIFACQKPPPPAFPSANASQERLYWLNADAGAGGAGILRGQPEEICPDSTNRPDGLLFRARAYHLCP
ncbi:MAG: hypothetical protein D5R99_00095, partial [Methanocalculus sp. MSAO_Arc1]